MTTLIPWIVTDDPANELSNDECPWTALVWAATADDALLLAAGRYDGDAPTDRDYREALRATAANDDERQRLAEYAPDWPTVEHRPIVERLAGWRLDGETACESCGLAAMGLDQYAVCPDCHCCPECAAKEETP